MTKIFVLFFTILCFSLVWDVKGIYFPNEQEDQNKKILNIGEIQQQGPSRMMAEEKTIEYTRLGIPKIIWTYWNQQVKEDDHFFQIFIANRKKMLEGWEIRLLSESTVWYWLNQIPDFDNALNQPQFQWDKQQKKADLIRLTLLKHFGGVYMDFTTILIENLDWIENLDQQEAVNNRFGDSPDVFLLYNSLGTERESATDPVTGKQFLLFPSFEVSFIVAKPKTQYLQKVFELFTFGRKKGYEMYAKNVGYEIYGNERERSYLVDIMQQEGIKTGGFRGKYFELTISTEIVLQRKQKQLDQLFKNGVDKVQRYAIQYYKIWVMGSDTSAFFYDSHPEAHIIFVLAQSDINMLKSHNLYPRYFVKLVSDTRNMLNNFLIKDKETFEKYPCEWDIYILGNSMLNKYLLSLYEKKFVYNPILQKPLHRECLQLRRNILEGSTRKKQIQIPLKQCFKKKKDSLIPEITLECIIKNVNVWFIIILLLIVIVLTWVSAIIIIKCSPKIQEKIIRLLESCRKKRKNQVGDSFQIDSKESVDDETNIDN